MIIALSPSRMDAPLNVERSGDALTINGQSFDFSPIPDGGLLPRAAVDCAYLASDVERLDGEIHLTLILPHGADAPEETRFPEPIHVTEDGPVPLPPYDAAPEGPDEPEAPDEPIEEPGEEDGEGEDNGD